MKRTRRKAYALFVFILIFLPTYVITATYILKEPLTKNIILGSIAGLAGGLIAMAIIGYTEKRKVMKRQKPSL